MNFSVYILYSPSRNLLYTGSTNIVHRRVRQHNNRESGFTAQGAPWVLLWNTTKSTKKEAELLERKIKNLDRGRKVEFMLKYEDGIENIEILETLH